ncbi:carboxypeptidase-like regulatory domain-containing protein [uncultured Desulfosarcina sp.]|uniref:carboxypeptidase-like regulatory domain-containing protein n=1 Tax=uncultured Desulfosarcina sp. TaxID=218289 RepID=UPI0029C7C684|nr:carboxypeptidase-like regulatory domain-containing protein [uncultured Desulfosarcina sp.]
MAASRFGLIFFLSAALLWSFPEPVNAGQWLQGSLYLTDETGQRIYGEYVSIFLTSEKIPVPRYPGIDKLERHRRLDRINQMHLDFYKYFAQYRNKPGYLVANAESSDDGTFAFLNVPPGDYYVVVTFPAMIGGYKVAWQQPVTVAAGRIRHVTLDSHNLALPTDRRE